jgi:V/A-type H+-transporting ATPase subunit I
LAISKIKVISIIGMMNSLDEVIKMAGESQVFHPDNALSFYSDTRGFSPVNEVNLFAEPLEMMKNIASSANFELKIVDISKFNARLESICEFVRYLENELGDLLNRRRRICEEIESSKRSLDGVNHFVGRNFNLSEIKACEYIKVRFGRLPKESYHKLNSYADNDYVLFFPCTKDNTHYFGVYFCPVEKLDVIDRIFSELYFEELDILDSEGVPEKKVVKLKNDINNCQMELVEINRKIDEFLKNQKDSWLKFYTKTFEFKTYFDIKKYVYRYNESFVLVGWLPDNQEQDFKNKLQRIKGVEYSIEDAKNVQGHSPPVCLKNRWFFKPFEFFVDMYGLPSYNEIDPTAFVAITYTILFGIMFGDLGQGAVISIIGYLLWKFKKMALGKILVPCGISSMFFGVVYGSVFGFEHVLDPFYRLVFKLEEKPIEVMNPGIANMILLSAIGIGVLLVLVAMGINVYSSFKRRQLADGIFGQNGVAGLVFYAGLIFGPISQFLGIKIFMPVYLFFMIILPLICILFEKPLGKLLEKDPDWKPESWGEYFMQSLFEVFEVILSYITNTLSFLRVGAFVLVHAGMMMVFSKLAEMSGGLGCLIFMIMGNIIVIGLEGLLVGIQVLRLEFYEMFIRFFEGQGVAFSPVSIKNYEKI